ncbi:transcriptional regulator [Actinoplanes sp. ATCC 53533]|uniref:helix-turn-helix domain-containing protein n=1 Tax=Actinoplanes sp. ATCC 53533 TaxID=1288362 RepID=UPI000F793A50|nr:helix-turn-helix transcriptional regulator [Actinoplanes sp. ATCC 53533]RSM44999.1 transcriptional regulator [Actinoplanes sp. ATCC 53533]
MVRTTPSPPDGKGRPSDAYEILGRSLRLLRESCGFKVKEAAQLIDVSPSKISRIELGRVGIKEVDLDRLLTLYGISDDNERLAFLERNHRLSEPRWWSSYSNHLSEWYCSYLHLESEAKYILEYEVRLIPGLLQTRAYAEAVIRSTCTDEQQVRRLIDVRMRRQRMVLERGAPKLWAIVEHAALVDSFDDSELMQEQIDFLLRITGSSDVRIQVLMPGAGALAFRGNSFSILQMKASEVVYMEHLDRAFFLDERKDSEPYRLAMSELVIVADEPRKSRTTLEEISRRNRMR